jgi:FAD/FMN-containing dehydrogenase
VIVASTLNDVHSRLNPTVVRHVEQPASAEDVRTALLAARAADLPVAVAGARHAMGGQQFISDGVVLDMTGMRRILALDTENGLVEVEAGIDWHTLIGELVATQVSAERQWGIIQKPTGADGLTIGGSVGSNVHGRGLKMSPFVQDIESFVLLDADGEVYTCSRLENVELFRLVIGGYGLFGVVTSVRLRLSPRQKLERVVEWVDVDDLSSLFDGRVADGFLYGDCQFVIDSRSGDFLDDGILSCYKPADPAAEIPDGQRALSLEDWQKLLYLAHVDKAAALGHYRAHYLATSGQIYWSDLHQRSEYVGGYHAALDALVGADMPGSEMITELYVPPNQLASFMHAAADHLRDADADVVYGTIRLIEPDGETFLPWAKDRYACVIFNLHIEHDDAGVARAADAFRGLIDLAIVRSGSYYLTYHRWATRNQLETCYPKFGDLLAHKAERDPTELFQSDWYRHQRALLEAPAAEVTE